MDTRPIELHGVTPTAALVCLSLDLRMAREEHARKKDPTGAVWCRQHGTGRRRELLGYAGPANIVRIKDTEADHALNDARQFLHEHCRICGLCELAKA